MYKTFFSQSGGHVMSRPVVLKQCTCQTYYSEYFLSFLPLASYLQLQSWNSRSGQPFCPWASLFPLPKAVELEKRLTFRWPPLRLQALVLRTHYRSLLHPPKQSLHFRPVRTLTSWTVALWSPLRLSPALSIGLSGKYWVLPFSKCTWI